MISSPIIYRFFKDFTNHRKKTKKVVAFSCRPFPNILKYRDHQWDFLKSENKTPSDKYWIVLLVCMKNQALNSLEPLLEYNQDQMSLINQSLLWPFWSSCELPETNESSRFQFLQKFLAKQFAYQMHNTIPLGLWIEEVWQNHFCSEH